MLLDPPIKCPTCGADMHLALVGKTHPLYVTVCPTVAVKHPTTICTPTIVMSEPNK